MYYKDLEITKKTGRNGDYDYEVTVTQVSFMGIVHKKMKIVSKRGMWDEVTWVNEDDKVVCLSNLRDLIHEKSTGIISEDECCLSPSLHPARFVSNMEQCTDWLKKEGYDFQADDGFIHLCLDGETIPYRPRPGGKSWYACLSCKTCVGIASKRKEVRRLKCYIESYLAERAANKESKEICGFL
ncbi:MAG: hypothetical protein GY799_21115 [Desulfobulbaceae bacterium]|nr:hypothetical protein [Desulfobulbaceae bacterium]